jgi:hypothetical protein
VSDRYPYLSDGVKQRIARGEVPPPRTTTDPPDPIRDLKLDIAIAQDNGNQAAVDRLNVQWLRAARKGLDADTWEPPEPTNRNVGQPVSKAELLRAAKKADDAGQGDVAFAYRAKAMHAPEADVRDKLKTTYVMEAAEGIEGGGVERGRRERAAALQELRGGLPPQPAPPPPAQPQTAQEFNAAISKADADGDQHAANRLRTGLLGLNRAATEQSMSL